MKIAYTLTNLLLKLVLFLFFRDIEVVGLENVPEEGPLILVGNHHNQFVDPAILLTQTPREVRFLIAAKSLKRVMVGFFARLLRSIPVSRPQDLAQKGIGLLSAGTGSKEIIGVHTKFTTQVKVGDLLSIKGISKEGEGIRVAEVKANDVLIVDKPMTTSFTTCEFKVIPHVDQSSLYEEVTKSLASGTCVGLFPEGGSHDRADLLPLKAGVAVMALSASAALRDRTPPGQIPPRVRIVPCGMNYFQGHRFRSHVLVEFGKPIEVTDEMMELYAKDRREAYASLLKIVEQRMKSVTIIAPDLRTLQAIMILRRIYQPENAELTPEQYLELNRRFVEAYFHFHAEPKIQALKEKALEYIDKLRIWGLKDHQVVSLPPLTAVDRYILLMGRIVVFLFLVLLALPGLVLNLPVGIVARTLALRHAKTALAGSNVKITGRDVIASYKILVSLVVWPVLHLFYTAFVVYKFGWTWGLVSWFVIFPILAHASVRLFETGREMWESNLPLFLSLSRGGEKYHKELQKMRQELKQSVRVAVENYGPQLPHLWSNRIFSDDKLQTSGPAALPSRVSYVKKDKKKMERA